MSIPFPNAGTLLPIVQGDLLSIKVDLIRQVKNDCNTLVEPDFMGRRIVLLERIAKNRALIETLDWMGIVIPAGEEPK